MQRQVEDACETLSELRDAEEILLGGGQRRRMPYGAGLISSPAPYGYGNIAGCNMYGGAGKYKYGFNIRQEAKVLNDYLNNYYANLPQRERTNEKINFLADQINSNSLAPKDLQTYFYLVNLIKRGQDNIAKAQAARQLPVTASRCQVRYKKCLKRVAKNKPHF